MSRYYIFLSCLQRLGNKEKKDNNINVLELGTTRSFVDDRFEDCLSTDKKFLKPKDTSVWDWSAVCFTKVFSDCLDSDSKTTSVDIDNNAMIISKEMNKDKDNTKFVHGTSKCFLSRKDDKFDLIYVDTGGIDKATELLSLREAKIIVSRDIIKPDGFLLIDDVRNLNSLIKGKTSFFLGKASSSIPYLLDNGFKILMDEYQVLMRRSIVI